MGKPKIIQDIEDINSQLNDIVRLNSFVGATDTEKLNTGITYCNTNDKILFINEGNWNIDRAIINDLDTSKVVISSNAKFYDSDSGQYFIPNLPQVNLPFMFYPYKSKYFYSVRSRMPSIVCYGDSNTRGYYGDTSTNMELMASWSSMAEVISMKYTNISGAHFINQGNPGQTAEYGDSNFDTQVGSKNPSVVVLGWGTNNVRPNSDLVSYLSAMESMINKIIGINALPIILTIPDYSDQFTTDLIIGKHRIKVWNTFLINLADKYNAPIIDVYTLFNTFKIDQHATWYNETSTPWRHFSMFANQVIADKVCSIISSYSSNANIKTDYRYGISTSDNIISGINGLVQNDTSVSFNSTSGIVYRPTTIKLTNNASIPAKVTFKCSADLTIGFIGRGASGIANITVKDMDGNVLENNTFDTYAAPNNGSYDYSIKKYISYVSNRYFQDVILEISTSNTKNTSSSGFDIWLCAISATRIIADGDNFTTKAVGSLVDPLIIKTGKMLPASNGLVYFKYWNVSNQQQTLGKLQSVMAGTTAQRPPYCEVGQNYFDTTLGKPIWVKIAPVYDASYNITTPATWVDSAGTTV